MQGNDTSVDVPHEVRIGFGPKEAGEKEAGNWLQRLIAAFRTQY